MWVIIILFFSKLNLGDSMWDCGYGLTEDRGIIDHRLGQLQSSVEMTPFPYNILRERKKKEKKEEKRKGGHATVHLILAPTFRAECLSS